MIALLWGVFIALVVSLLVLDLRLLHRKDHADSVREALGWTAFYASLAMLFSIAVYFLYRHNLFGLAEATGARLSGRQAALQYVTGYIIELSLSLDNVFVMALIFDYFHVPRMYQHRVLYWGILGAIVMRGVMILVGGLLILRFRWVTYAFGALLIFTALRMLTLKAERIDPEHNPLVRLARRFFPVTGAIRSHDFFARPDGKLHATPLFLALLMVESADVVFAVDSIPAIYAITRAPFIVFTSNVFAILGLRSLYVALAAVIERFRYMKVSLFFLLGYVGVKMLLSGQIHIPTGISLAIVISILALGILTSALRKAPPTGGQTPSPESQRS